VTTTRVPVAARSASWASSVGGLGAVLLPKCPLCFAAYGSGLAALGVSPAAQSQLVDLFLAIAVTASFVLVLALSVRRRDALTPVVSGAGVLFVLVGRLALGVTALTAVGAVLLVTAAVVNSVRCRITAR
jgi:predicted branched-subunit amino acid permease